MMQRCNSYATVYGSHYKRLFGIIFITTSSQKGTFHTDEPGGVMMTLNSYQSPYQVYRFAAISSQPPLDQLIRTYFLSYWVKPP